MEKNSTTYRNRIKAISDSEKFDAVTVKASMPPKWMKNKIK